MRVRVLTIVALSILSSCSQSDGTALRHKAIAALAGQQAQPVPDMPVACGPGSMMARTRGCVLEDAKRDELRRHVEHEYEVVVSDFFTLAREHRDELAGLIVQDEARSSEMLEQIVRLYADCTAPCDPEPVVRGTKAELRNALIATLSAAIGDVEADRAAVIWRSENAFPLLAKVSDDYLMEAQITASSSIEMQRTVRATLAEHARR